MEELEILLKVDHYFQTKFECSYLSPEQLSHLPTGTAWKGMYNWWREQEIDDDVKMLAMMAEVYWWVCWGLGAFCHQKVAVFEQFITSDFYYDYLKC